MNVLLVLIIVAAAAVAAAAEAVTKTYIIIALTGAVFFNSLYYINNLPKLSLYSYTLYFYKIINCLISSI